MELITSHYGLSYLLGRRNLTFTIMQEAPIWPVEHIWPVRLPHMQEFQPLSNQFAFSRFRSSEHYLSSSPSSYAVAPTFVLIHRTKSRIMIQSTFYVVRVFWSPSRACSTQSILHTKVMNQKRYPITQQNGQGHSKPGQCGWSASSSIDDCCSCFSQSCYPHASRRRSVALYDELWKVLVVLLILLNVWSHCRIILTGSRWWCVSFSLSCFSQSCYPYASRRRSVAFYDELWKVLVVLLSSSSRVTSVGWSWLAS